MHHVMGLNDYRTEDVFIVSKPGDVGF